MLSNCEKIIIKKCTTENVYLKLHFKYYKFAISVFGKMGEVSLVQSGKKYISR